MRVFLLVLTPDERNLLPVLDDLLLHLYEEIEFFLLLTLNLTCLVIGSALERFERVYDPDITA